MQYTNNLKLKKPETSDFYNVNDFNENMDLIDDELKDSGWADLKLINTSVIYFPDNDSKLQYRKVGKMVQIRGTVAISDNYTDNGSFVGMNIYPLPTEFAPSKKLEQIQGRDDKKTCCIRINTGGNILLGKYGHEVSSSSSYYIIKKDTQIYVNLMYFVD